MLNEDALRGECLGWISLDADCSANHLFHLPDLSGLLGLSGDATELLLVEMLAGAVLFTILTALPGKMKNAGSPKI